MIFKIAITDTTPVSIVEKQNSGEHIVRTASSRIMIDRDSDIAKIVEAEIKKHPNALFFKSKAIEANVANTNGDYFSEEELLKAYKTFEGVPFFTNHDNQNVENARGKVIFAQWVPEEKSVYTISFVDRDAYPHICRSIEEEYVTGVSMGCSVEYSVCNICGNRAEKTQDYCSHIRNRKARKFTGRSKHMESGEVKDFKDELVFEYNHGIKFIELSAVVDPACPSCKIQGIIPNEDYMQKVASIQNELWMIKTAAIEKKASQEEIQQIEQVLETLDNMAINLLKNRKQIDPEFASDLVDIISQLQTWLDELTGAGYGKLGGGDVPGTVGNAPSPQAGNVGAAPSSVPAPAPMPVSAEQNLAPEESGMVGTVAGSPSKSLVQGPKLPISSPIKPRTADSRVVERLCDFAREYEPNIEHRDETGSTILKKAENLMLKLNKTGDVNMGKRRTISAKEEAKEEAKQILENSWKEKQEFFEYIKQVPSIQDNDFRLSVKRRDDSFIIVAEKKDMSESENMVWTYDDLSKENRRLIIQSPREAAKKLLETFANSFTNQKEGVNRMTDINKNAGANSVNANPDVVQEKQLEQATGLYHGRTGEDKHSITQKQLESVRSGEKDYLTEKQLDDTELTLNPRTNTEVDVVQEAQMKGDNRKDEEKHSITQKQLEEYRSGNEKDTITEDQLKSISAPWARAAKKDPALFKTAKEHMKAVVDVMANSVLACGCTPDEACEVAASLVDSTKNRLDLMTSIVSGEKGEDQIDYAKRTAFWNNKNLKVAGVGRKEIASSIIEGLRKVASNVDINPDVIVTALDLVGEEGVDGVSERVEQKINEVAEKKEASVNMKEEMRSALKTASSQESKSTKEQRDAERLSLLASLEDSKQVKQAKVWNNIINKEAAKDSDVVIETNFAEVGCPKTDPSFKKSIFAFTNAALASQNMKLASITNVTISGDTIQIAVQTGTEENEVNIDAGTGTTEIPVGENAAPAIDETMPEGDLTGEGLENTMGTPPAPASSNGYQSWAKTEGKMKKVAQSPAGGGMSQVPGGVSATGSPEGGLPGSTPQGEPIQSLTTDLPDEGAEDIPTVGEQQVPWAICPECGSADSDVSNGDNGDISGKCNSCGAEWDGMLEKTFKFKIKKPTKSTGEEGAESPEEPAAPEVPALPVAAQTRIDKDSIKRIASNRQQYGHVCPACGNKNCEPSIDKEGHTEFTCTACKTDVEKDILISASSPDVSVIRVKWDLVPKTENCVGCSEEIAKFASRIKIEKLLKEAESKGDQFPTQNCIERIARQYGGNTVGSFGKCKGKLLADCVCSELKKLGFTKVRHLKKFAEVSVQKDPMDECLDEQKKNGHSIKEASALCKCLKEEVIRKGHVTPLVDNVYAQAFGQDVLDGKEPELNPTDLIVLDELDKEAAVNAELEIQNKVAMADEEDISAALAPVSAKVEEKLSKKADIATICPKCDKPTSGGPDKNNVCKCGDTNEKKDDKKEPVEANEKEKNIKEAKGFFCDKCKKPCKSCECKKDGGDDTDGKKDDKEDKDENDDSAEKKEASVMDGKRVRKSSEEVLKMASTPKQVDNIEGNVEAGVPRSEAYMGEEKSADSMINKTPAKPNVPRSPAYMGKEQQADSMINKELKLPNVEVDSSYMGHEKEMQSGMPAINNEIKGTVIADAVELTVKDGKIATVKKIAKQMKEVDSVEGDVEAGVPRGKATIGNEGKDNIDVPMNTPKVPRAKATMGNEGKDNIDVPMNKLDVPIDNAYMGNEKEIQKDMPAINDEMLKQVKMNREKQLERLAAAREKEAVKTAAWLVANGRLASDKGTYENAIKALSAFEIDQITVVAESLFPEKQMKKAATTDKKVVEASGYAIPAIIMETKQQTDGSQYVDKLSSIFTIGNSKFDKDLTIYGEKSK